MGNEQEASGRTEEQTKNGDRIVKPTRYLVRGAVGEILSNPDFPETYRGATILQGKYAIAVELINDGRYPNPRSLFQDFIPTKQVIERLENPQDRQLAEQEIKERGTELKDSLAFLLLQKGSIGSRTKEAEDAASHIERVFKNDQNIQDLASSGVPVEVLGQLMTLKEFSEISSEEKLEELRSWTTHAILRPYLGTLAGKMPRKELGIIDIMDRIPKEIFGNPYALRYNLVERYFEQQLMQHITDSGRDKGMEMIEEVVAQIEDKDKKAFMDRIYLRLYDIATFPLKGDFKGQILVKGQERDFPSFEQRAFCYDFVKHSTRLLTAETGLGKTAAAYLAMENSDATKVLILPPANGRETWKIEEEVIFTHSGNVFVVNGSSDLDKARDTDKKYIVVGQELLGLAENDPVLLKKLHAFISKTKIDGAIIDEVDNLNNPKAFATRIAVSLIEMVRKNYFDRTKKDNAPVIGLTATPIRSELSDLNVPMGILYPHKYAITPGDSTGTKKTFSDTYLNRPDVTYIALTGEKRMFRWEKASGVQELSYKTISIQVSPFEQLLYEFIGEEVGGDALNKIRLLEDALLNPLLVKAEVRMMANGKIPKIDIDNALEILKKVALEWKETRGVDMPETEEDYLNIDRLVELGFSDLVLGGFFSDLLENGLDTLVLEMTKNTKDEELELLGKFWQKKELSSKYQALRQQLIESLTWRIGNDGKLHRNKVMIISPTKKQGRLGDVLQREIKTADGASGSLYADYELDTINDSTLIKLLEEWISDLCKDENTLLLDGSVSIGRKRNAVIDRWVNSPEDAVLFGTLEAMYQSRDFTINTLVDKEGRRIDGVTKIFLHWPWYWQQFKQMVGRSQRQGQLIPVNTVVLEAKDLIDQGKGDVVRYTYLLSRIALSGVSLAPEDKEFFDSKKIGKSKIRFQNTDARFLRDVLSIVRGRGEDEIEKIMTSGRLDDGKNNYERFAQRFFDEGKDEYRTSGYNAELISFLIRELGFSEKRILSLGAGTLLLQRKLQKGIDNVDMNPYIMQAGWKLASEFGGRMFVAKASSLNKNEFLDVSYDSIDSSFALHWSSLGEKVSKSERVAILSQINRLLTEGGAFFLTVPEGVFDEEKFQIFTRALESSFGFRIERQYSGKSYGVSKMGSVKRLGWSIVGFKKRTVNLDGLQISDLEFLNEKNEWVSKDSGNKNGNPAVRGGDYPTPGIKLKFDRYQIVGVDNAITTLLSKKVFVSQPVFVFDASLTFLRGTTQEDYKVYKIDLVRPLMKAVKLNWEQAEQLAVKLLLEISKERKPKNKEEAFRRILRKVSSERNGRKEI